MWKDIRFYLSEILKNERGEYSSANLWLHIGNAAITFAYVYIVWYAAKLNPIPLEGLSFLTFIMGGLITGNKLAHKFMNMRYGSVSLEGPKNAGATN